MGGINMRFFVKTAMLFTLFMPIMATSNELSDEKLSAKIDNFEYQLRQNDLANTLNKIDPESSSTRLPRNRSALEAILGSWVLSYNVGASSYTDRMTMNEIVTTSDGSIMAQGVYDRNQSGKQLMRCLYSPLDSPTKTDYICVSATTGISQAFAFSVSGNSITNGFYDRGDSEQAGLPIATRQNPVTGYRVDSQSTSEANDVTYYEVGDRIFIPKINYRGNNYRVTLRNQGDFTFNIERAELIH